MVAQLAELLKVFVGRLELSVQVQQVTVGLWQESVFLELLQTVCCWCGQRHWLQSWAS